MPYPAISLSPKSGDERFHRGGQPFSMSLADFWRWSASDLLSNATRGILAEFIVARALDVEMTVRSEWDAFDLLTPAGMKIEVKSAAYLQSWFHEKLSTILFDIRPTFGWDAASNTRATEIHRQADVYVFCLLAHTDKETVDPLDLDQWTFFILPTAVLDEKCPTQKTISLAPLRGLGAVECDVGGIAAAVAAALPGRLSSE